MKITLLLVLVFFALSSYTQPNKKMRCFMIGYIADTVYENGHRNVYSGGEDTCMTHYPNCIELVEWIQKKHHCETTRILGISEYSYTDRKRFWKGINN